MLANIVLALIIAFTLALSIWKSSFFARLPYERFCRKEVSARAACLQLFLTGSLFAVMGIGAIFFAKGWFMKFFGPALFGGIACQYLRFGILIVRRQKQRIEHE